MSTKPDGTTDDAPTTPTPRTALRDTILAGLSEGLDAEQVDAIEESALDVVDRTALWTGPLPDWYSVRALKGRGRA